MEKPLRTQDKLLLHARRQFCSHGYYNVFARKIASEAGVDVALISRYFGSKLGLFRATLDGAFALGKSPPSDAKALVEGFVKFFSETSRSSTEPSSLLMLVTNAHDETVGDLIRTSFQNEITAYLVNTIGSEDRAALFITVLLGMSIAEKSLHLQGIGEPGGEQYEAQLRHMMVAALTFTQADGA